MGAKVEGERRRGTREEGRLKQAARKGAIERKRKRETE